MVATPRRRTDKPKKRAAARWLWLPYLASPILLGVVVSVFPLDRPKAGLALIATLVALALADALPRSINRSALAFAGACTLLIMVLSLPFWALKSTNAPNVADVRPAFSYREARANPDAFAKWWNFFVEEVVRVQPVIYEPDPQGTAFDGKLPYRPRPGVKIGFYRGSIAINNQGYRGDDFPRAKGDVYRILTLGDSVTFGQTLFPESRTWSAALQDLIVRRLRCNKPVQVVNGGVNAFHLRNGIDRLRRDYAWLKPDLVLTYFGWNSMSDIGINPPAPAMPAPPRAGSRVDRVRWYIEKAAVSLPSDVIARARNSLEEIVGTRKKIGADTDALLDKARNSALHRDYQTLIEHARRSGYRLALASFNTAVAPDGPEEAKAFYQAVTHAVRPLLIEVSIHNTLLRELAADTGTTFVDSGTDLYGKYDDDLYIDIVHFSPKGDTVMAANVFRGIRPLLLADSSLGCRPR